MNKPTQEVQVTGTAECAQTSNLYYWLREASEEVHRLIDIGEFYDAADLLKKIMVASKLRRIHNSYYSDLADLASTRQRDDDEGAVPDGLRVLDFWNALNECWFAFQDVPDKELLHDLCRHLVELCVNLEADELVDHEMGILKESIMRCFIRRIDELSRIEKEYKRHLHFLFQAAYYPATLEK
ncbi:uncharacterized protein BO97DRAFT_428784 [Aspergillus homomorphus CBS 101889]|uniref:Uncharacterized protein n=1 Tax=Aspergillus homomorphus (strain CBS 101889) TaxID=1450537 RepID=A0A395HJM2_ASPHC|nr:hypothetical protein BO97DRAFT_428784 [Aspergillus homomorphus CBS 101889]RAL07970.1 hypothetical protein BO97DRAFT_428784 [Aspergillus homomorphus CBS 101889]